jgi:(3S)-malyl-CoA thioesterase
VRTNISTNITTMRSLLYVPGSAAHMMLKARDSAADALILDLEDAVAPEQKQEARATVARVLRELDFGGKEVFVRINALTTSYGLEDARPPRQRCARALVTQSRERRRCHRPRSGFTTRQHDGAEQVALSH